MKIRKSFSFEMTQEEAEQLVTEMAEVNSSGVHWGTDLKMLRRLTDALSDSGVKPTVEFKKAPE